jgi:hypothetical protein
LARLEIREARPSGCSAIRSAFAGGVRSSGATSRLTKATPRFAATTFQWWSTTSAG